VAAVRLEPLLVWVIQRCDDFTRKHKFSIADRWIEVCLDVQASLVEAAYVRDQKTLLQTASRGLVRARVLARLACSLRALSGEQLAYFDRESLVVGRMVGGWLRALGRRATAAPSSVGSPPSGGSPRGEVGPLPTG
jgi:hypothetical protein